MDTTLVLVSGKEKFALVRWFSDKLEDAQEGFRHGTGFTPTYIFNLKKPTK